MKDWTLDDSARVWVHVANRRMTPDEASAVQLHLDQFVVGWQAHGASLAAEASVVHGWMVVLAVDERPQQATGCSIDASVSALKQIGTHGRPRHVRPHGRFASSRVWMCLDAHPAFNVLGPAQGGTGGRL